jgi:hypothetical protein
MRRCAVRTQVDVRVELTENQLPLVRKWNAIPSDENTRPIDPQVRIGPVHPKGAGWGMHCAGVDRR